MLFLSPTFRNAFSCSPIFRFRNDSGGPKILGGITGGAVEGSTTDEVASISVLLNNTVRVISLFAFGDRVLLRNELPCCKLISAAKRKMSTLTLGINIMAGEGIKQ